MVAGAARPGRPGDGDEVVAVGHQVSAMTAEWREGGRVGAACVCVCE